jgi:hypothetical protein
LGVGLTTPQLKNNLFTKFHKGPRAWTDSLDKLEKLRKMYTNSKNKNIRGLYRGINKFTRGYQTRSNLVKDYNGGLLADIHNIWNMWKNYLLNKKQHKQQQKQAISSTKILTPRDNHIGRNM